MRATSYRRGIDAERLCRWALRLKCYRILAVRYQTAAGEIDIVAQRGNTVVAVEVKARESFDRAAEALSAQQQARIARALTIFIQRHPCWTHANLRLDLMLAPPGRWPRHIPNAWQAQG